MDTTIEAGEEGGGIGESPIQDLASELAPVSGATMFRLEVQRREGLRKKGCAPTGCPEIDQAVLLSGGFEFGSVVGISAETIDFGILLSLQTIARSLVLRNASHEPSTSSETVPKIAVITTLAVTTILPILRDAIRVQAETKGGPQSPDVTVVVRRCLEAISISRVFDIQGLWEVLRELEDRAQESLRNRHDNATLRYEDEASGVPNIPNVPIQERPLSGEEHADVLSAEQGNIKNIVKNNREQLPRDRSPATSPRSPVTELPPLRIPSNQRPRTRKLEILDSEDEGGLSSSATSSPITEVALPPVSPEGVQQISSHASKSDTTADSEMILPQAQTQYQTQNDIPRPAPPRPRPVEDSPLPIPEVILVTHFSALLTTIFANHDKTTAHTALQRLSSHLRYLARSTGSLIILLNTTTSPSPSTDASATSSTTPQAHRPHQHEQKGPQPETGLDARTRPRPLDPTLRSIFNPLPFHHHGHGQSMANSAARRNKPSFGVTFTQFLDLHLLCTRVPRSRDDAEAAVALGVGGGGGGGGDDGIKFAWVVEVLLDELGFWDWKGAAKGGRGKGEIGVRRGKRTGMGRDKGERILPPRVNREQRWGAVDVRDGVRIVDAFPPGGSGGGNSSGGGGGSVNRGPIRLAAGFGGPRV